jgi:hypothetical protein
MGARMLVTKTGRPAFGRWSPTSGRPPVLLLILVLLLLLAAIAVGMVAEATGIRGAEANCRGDAGLATSASLSVFIFRDVAGGDP